MRISVAIVLVIMLLAAALSSPLAFATPRGKSFELNTVSNSVCPVDGTPISVTAPIQTKFDGRSVGFCCSECKQKFMANPDRYSANIR